MSDQPIGFIKNYYSKIQVAHVKCLSEFKNGMKIRIKGSTTDFEMEIKSMQIDRVDIGLAKPSQEIGMVVDQLVRKGDNIYPV